MRSGVLVPEALVLALRPPGLLAVVLVLRPAGLVQVVLVLLPPGRGWALALGSVVP